MKAGAPLAPIRHFLQFKDFTADSVIRLLPPLILSAAEADELVAILVPLLRDFLATPVA